MLALIVLTWKKGCVPRSLPPFSAAVITPLKYIVYTKIFVLMVGAVSSKEDQSFAVSLAMMRACGNVILGVSVRVDETRMEQRGPCKPSCHARGCAFCK